MVGTQFNGPQSDIERRPVAIIALTWNALAITKKCLRILKETTDHPAWRLIVVDNGSTDGTVEWLRSLSWVSVIANPINLGYTKGCNQGLEACEPNEDVVLLNNDVFVQSPDWLSRLQEIAYESPETAIVGTRLVDETGVLIHLGSYMPPIHLFGIQIAGLEADLNQRSANNTVESVVFAQAYIKRDCIEQIGFLDEDLFAYFEDSDYCLRALRAGRTIVCAGGVRSVHRQSTSTLENKADFWSVYNPSREVFSKKWSAWLEHDRYEAEVAWHSVVHQPLGYAVQSKNLMREMHFADLRVSYRNAYGQSDEATGNFLIDDLMKRSVSSDAIQIAFCQADAFGGVKGRYKVGWSMLEVDGLPDTWVQGCNQMDEIWVPASFNVEGFRESGVTSPIKVMPLGVDTDYYNPQIKPFRASERFTFLSIFEWGERKAPEILLKSFADEFRKSEDVLLILAVSNRDPEVDVYGEIESLNLPPDAPIVVMLNSRLPDYQMGSLYRSADCFVLPSRGEGWGMPVLEAMACGLPTIATNWSGPADFLHEGIGYPLQTTGLVDAQARCVYYDGFRWAQPNTDHLRFLMREVYEHPDAAREKGLAAAKEVAAKYSWQAAAQRIKNRLSELGELKPGRLTSANSGGAVPPRF